MPLARLLHLLQVHPFDLRELSLSKPLILLQASSLIFVSEIGDKTFFIATLLAARASKLLTFAGCAGALALMTVISVLIGQIFHAVPASVTRGGHAHAW